MIPNNLDNHAGDGKSTACVPRYPTDTGSELKPGLPLCDRLDAPYRPGAKARAEKAFKMLEFIKDSMSPESTVCDSVMMCDGWERWAATILAI